MSRQGNRHWSGKTYQRLASLGLVFALHFFLSAEAQANPTEPELRAAVIVAIMRFTAWPPASADVSSALQVCLAGKPISAKHLSPISGQQKVAGHTVNVKTIPGSDISDCQVLVLGEQLTSERMATLLQAADSTTLLSICDGCQRELSDQTIIHLTLRKQRVNFEVNLVKAKTNGLALDAQLLELASVVRK